MGRKGARSKLTHFENCQALASGAAWRARLQGAPNGRSGTCEIARRRRVVAGAARGSGFAARVAPPFRDRVGGGGDYNDGYGELGTKHPDALGQSFRDLWRSAWNVLGDAFEQASLSRASLLEDQRVFLDRNGRAYAHPADSYVRKPADCDEFVAASRGLGLYWTVTNVSPPVAGL